MKNVRSQDGTKRPIWKSILKWIGITVAGLIVAIVSFICIVRGVQFDEKPSSIDSDVSITKSELVTEKNGTEIARVDVTDKVDADFNHVPFNATYDAKYGDEFCIYVVAEDSLGYTHKVLAYYWYEIDENTSQAIADVGNHTEIYDKDGNLMTGGY